MGIESLLRDMKRDVSAVSDVHPSIGAGLRDTAGTYRDVSAVSADLLHWRPDTADTAATKEPYRLKPAPALACTSDTGDTSQKQHAQRNGAVFRRWQVTDPSGKCWSVTCCPPVAHGEMAATWPPCSVLTPVPDAPMPTDSPPLPAAVEAKIRAWLGHIGEQDQGIVGEVLTRCQHEPDVLRFYLDQARNVPVEKSSRDENP